MREAFETWLQGETVKIDELSAELKPLAIMLGKAILDMDNKLDKLGVRVDSITTRYDEHVKELQNIPASLKKADAEAEYAAFMQKLELMWAIGKWLAGGIGAGLMLLAGKAILNSLGITI